MTNLFDKISVKNQEKILKLLEAHCYELKKNNQILPIIKEENMLAYIVKGYIQIIKIDQNGTRTIMEEIEEEEIFGSTISALKTKEFEVITKEDTILFTFDYQRITKETECDKEYFNQFTKNLLQILMEKMKKKNERIEILSKKTIRNRLLEYFNIEANKHGSKYIYLPFNFTDLADYLGVDRSAMSRELSHLKEEKQIEVKGKKITLLFERYNYKNN